MRLKENGIDHLANIVDNLIPYFIGFGFGAVEDKDDPNRAVDELPKALDKLRSEYPDIGHHLLYMLDQICWQLEGPLRDSR